MEVSEPLMNPYEDAQSDASYSSYPADTSTESRRSNSSSSNTLKYLTLATALVAVCIGTAALVVSVRDGDHTQKTQQQVNAVNDKVVLETHKQSVKALVSSHPSCSQSMSNYQSCIEMSTKAAHVIDYASQENTNHDDLINAVNNNTFGASAHAAVVLHTAGTIVAADSTLAGEMGKVKSWLTNSSYCQFNDTDACYGCVPLSNGKQCLPVTHFKVMYRYPPWPSSKVQSSQSYTAYHTSGTSGTVVGSPTTYGASYHATGQVTAGNAGYSASATNSGGGNMAAHASAHATALSATGQVSGTAHANLGDGVGVTANGQAEAHAHAGVSAHAGASTHVGNGEATVNAGIGASARADAGVSGTAQANLNTPLGNLNLGTVSGGASADAHAGAAASATGSIGENGVAAHVGAQAGAGVSANAHGSFSLLGGAIHDSASVGASAGPEANVGGGFHATDTNGDISVGVSGGAAALLGLHGSENLNINTHQIGSDVVNGVENGVHDVENLFHGGSSGSSGSSANSADDGSAN